MIDTTIHWTDAAIADIAAVSAILHTIPTEYLLIAASTDKWQLGTTDML